LFISKKKQTFEAVAKLDSVTDLKKKLSLEVWNTFYQYQQAAGNLTT